MQRSPRRRRFDAVISSGPSKAIEGGRWRCHGSWTWAADESAGRAAAGPSRRAHAGARPRRWTPGVRAGMRGKGWRERSLAGSGCPPPERAVPLSQHRPGGAAPASVDYRGQEAGANLQGVGGGRARREATLPRRQAAGSHRRRDGEEASQKLGRLLGPESPEGGEGGQRGCRRGGGAPAEASEQHHHRCAAAQERRQGSDPQAGRAPMPQHEQRAERRGEDETENSACVAISPRPRTSRASLTSPIPSEAGEARLRPSMSATSASCQAGAGCGPLPRRAAPRRQRRRGPRSGWGCGAR